MMDIVSKPRILDADGKLDAKRSGAGINIAELKAEELVELTLPLHARQKVKWFFKRWVHFQWGRIKELRRDIGDVMTLMEMRNPADVTKGICRCSCGDVAAVRA